MRLLPRYPLEEIVEAHTYVDQQVQYEQTDQKHRMVPAFGDRFVVPVDEVVQGCAVSGELLLAAGPQCCDLAPDDRCRARLVIHHHPLKG